MFDLTLQAMQDTRWFETCAHEFFKTFLNYHAQIPLRHLRKYKLSFLVRSRRETRFPTFYNRRKSRIVLSFGKIAFSFGKTSSFSTGQKVTASPCSVIMKTLMICKVIST